MLTYVKIENVNQHEFREFNMVPGLTVVLGAQGSGKTNLCLWKLASLTNENPLAGLKENNIRWGAEGLRSAVTTRWSRDNHSYEVQRVFAKGKSSFAVDGVVDDTIRRENEITNAILSKLRVSKDAVMRYSFVAQSQTSALIQTLPTDKVRFIASLLGQDWMLDLEQKVANALTSFNDTLGVDYNQRVSESLLYYRQQQALIQDAKISLVNLDVSLPQLQARYEAMAELRGQLTRLDENELRLQNLRQMDDTAQRAIAVLQQSIANENTSLTNVLASWDLSVVWDIRYADAEVKRLEVELANATANSQTYTQQRELALQWQATRRVESNRVAMRNRLQSTEQRIADWQQWMQPPQPPLVPEVTLEQISAQETAAESLRRRIALLQTGKSECDKCGAPIAAQFNELSDKLTAQASLQVAMVNDRSALQSWVTYRASEREYNDKLPKAQLALQTELNHQATITAELASLPPEATLPDWIDDPQYQPAAIQARLDHAVRHQATLSSQLEQANLTLQNRQQVAQARLGDRLMVMLNSQLMQPAPLTPGQTYEAMVSRLQVSLAGSTSRLNELQRAAVDRALEIQTLTSQLADLRAAVDVNRRQEVVDAQQAWTAQVQQQAVTRQHLTQTEAQLLLARQAVRNCVATAKQHGSILRARDALLKIQNEVRPKELPREVLVRLMAGAAKSMTSLCYELGQPFDISISSELDFVIKKENGMLEVASRLSCGQQACVSCVFWLVRLLSRLGTSLPLLILDEPSANMDAQAVARFGEMLQRLGPILVERNLQVILITHHEQLRGCGQNVISL